MNTTRHDEMREAAIRFHREHPEVWQLFVRFTFELIHRGFQHYSARAIFHRIRWETAEAGVDQEKEFKIGNNHSPFYARRFMAMYPQYAPVFDEDGKKVEHGFFRTREQISKREVRWDLPELGPQDFPYTYEPEPQDQQSLF